METTKTIKQLIENTAKIGDTYFELATEEKSLDAAKVANTAYGNAVKALQVQVLYKKMMKKKFTIGFLEV